jgi:hypothetical protein
MANAYFLNSQNGEISIGLNIPLPNHALAALDSESNNPWCSLGLAASQDKDVLGTNSANRLAVNTLGQANSVIWSIEMEGIAPNEDIQFLVFENQLLARQGSAVKGFKIARISQAAKSSL